MIDINIVKVGTSYYSVKCNLTFENDERGSVVTAKILNVDLIDPRGKTSYTKLKNIFQGNGVQVLSRLKYQNIYTAITEKLIQKFRMDVLNI